MPELRVNGEPVQVPPGASLLAALEAGGAWAVPGGPGEAPQGPLCGMGICYGCRVEVDGRPALACLTPARDGQEVRRG